MSEIKIGMSFEEILKIDLKDIVRQKNNLDYIPWMTAWTGLKTIYPDATYEIVRTEYSSPLWGDAETGYEVRTRITANNETHEMWRPIIDFRNKIIAKPSMADVNSAMMRCLAKNVAMFGYGSHVYAGEEFYNDQIGNEIKVLQDQILELAKQMSAAKRKDEAIKLIGHGGVPTKIKDIKEAKEVIGKLENALKGEGK
jgi:hypothetical protein